MVSTFEIRVAEGSVSNNIVVVFVDGVQQGKNTRFSEAFANCVQHMQSLDILHIGETYISGIVAYHLSLAIKAGLAELKNPLPQPERQKAVPVGEESTLTEGEVPAELHWKASPEFPIRAFYYTLWDNRPALILLLGEVKGSIKPTQLAGYYKNPGSRWTEETSGPWNDFNRNNVRRVEAYLASQEKR